MYFYIYNACSSDLKQAPGLMGVLSAVAHDIPFTTDPNVLAAIHEHDKRAGMSFLSISICFKCDQWYVDILMYMFTY